MKELLVVVTVDVKEMLIEVTTYVNKMLGEVTTDIYFYFYFILHMNFGLYIVVELSMRQINIVGSDQWSRDASGDTKECC